MNMWFARIRQAVSGRLMSLKRRFGKPQMDKYSAMFHAWTEKRKDWWKETYLIVKCALLIAYIKLTMMLSPTAFKGYWQWLKNLPGQFTRENMHKWYAAFLVWLKNLPQTLKGLRKSGVLASLTLFALFLFMGHSATIALMTYHTPVAQNTFQVGELKLYVEYKNDVVPDYEEMTESSKLFNDHALYEPGYTQVVYLHIENQGNMDFDYDISVRAVDFTDSINVYGDTLHLPKYLRFGILTANKESELDRAMARSFASEEMEKYYNPLGTYTQLGSEIEAGKEQYAALVVFMPEYIGNEANYRTGATVPQVILGVDVRAQQAGTRTENP